MAKIQVIRQGESLPFTFDRSGESLTGWTCTIVAKQFPEDAAAIERVIPLTTDDDGNAVWEGFITQTESAALALGLWYLTGKLENTSTDEEETPPVRFQVTKAWA
jgi:hypothetical protein